MSDSASNIEPGPAERPLQPPAPANPAPATGSVTMLYQQLSAGDPLAAGQLWQRYFPRITAMARKTLAGRSQRAADADDAAQSAFINFWQQAARGQLGTQLDRDSLWNLLATITVRKALKQARREQAQKRGGGRVIGEDQLAGQGQEPVPLEQLIGQMSTHEFDLYSEELLLSLDDELRQIAVLRLLGHGTKEIAEQLHCTQRKVQRKLQLIQLRWDVA